MYQLTINAPKEKGWTHEHILEVMRGNFKTLVYICMADEQGSCYHTHIFVVFASRVRFSMVKRYFEEAHIEKCKGSVSDNVNYVKKTGKRETDESKQEKKIEGTFEEYGTQPPDSKGKRSDMSELYQMVMDNMTNAEILAQNQDYILQIDKIDKVRTTILTEKYKETLKEMLLYCDIYPIELPSRYANKFACYNKVYIVSNWSLEKQYTEVQREDRESWEAFLRRIHRVIIYSKDGSIQEYDSVKAYLEKNEFVEINDNIDLPFD